jgi:hypothetical protein
MTQPRSQTLQDDFSDRASERGSAYLIVLMLLVVLTLIGLSLSVITQTEIFIGGSEKQAARQFYAASSGIHLASVFQLVSRDAAAHNMLLARRDQAFFGDTVTIGDRVCTTPYIPLQVGTCNLCMLNQDSEFAAVQYGVSTSALRHGDEALAARYQMGAIIALEPWQRDFTGLAVGGDAPLRAPDDFEDIDPDTETDPCEGLYLRI